MEETLAIIDVQFPQPYDDRSVGFNLCAASTAPRTTILQRTLIIAVDIDQDRLHALIGEQEVEPGQRQPGVGDELQL